MVRQTEVEAMLVARIMVATDSGNTHHITHCEGQMRALLAVLTGETPPLIGRLKVTTILKLASIPHTEREDGSANIDELTLKVLGFKVDGDRATHPKYSHW
jgi:hypothetical protein